MPTTLYMRKLLVAAILFFGYHCLAQCPFAVTLQNKGSLCLGKDTLVVASANKLASIKWYKNGVVDTVVNAVVNNYAKNGVTVAGGNGEGAAANQISPRSIFVDAAGNLYVADYLAASIQKFPPNSTSATNRITVAGINANGFSAYAMQITSSVCLDGTGNIYAVDYGNNRVQKFPPNSTFGTNGITVAGGVGGNGGGVAANQFLGPVTACLDINGNIYVADMGNNRVQKFPPNSISGTNGITVAGGNGVGNAANQLWSPFSVYVDGGGFIYVADAMNNRIQKFPPNSTGTTNGVTVAGGNGAGSGSNQLNNPFSVFMDINGNLYVADLNNNRIQKFPPNSTTATNGITVAGGNGRGSTASQFSYPEAVFVDASGSIYVADYGNYRVQKFAQNYSTIDTTRTPTAAGTYYAVVTDTTGCTVTTNSIIVTGPVSPSINISTYGSPSACSAINTINYVAYIGYGGTTPVYQWQVNGVNIGTNSATFSAALAYKDVVSCTLTSNDACATTPTVASNKETVMVGKPVTVVLARKGNACLADTLVLSSTNKPYKIEWYKDGVLDTTLTVITTGNTKNGITVAGGNGRGNANNQFFGATSMALDAMGNIYVDDSYLNARVLKFPPNSTSTTKGVPVVSGLLAIPVILPLSAYVDVSGNIFTIDGTQRVLKLPPGNATIGTTVAGGNGSGSALNQLFGYAFCLDGSYNTYIADTRNNRVIKFPAGATSATSGVIVAGGNGTGSAANLLNQPYSVAVDNGGNIYVADYGNNRIQKFPPNSTSTTSGVTIAGGNGVGAAANQLSGPIWISFDTSGGLFVADQINNRIQKFPPNSTSATNGITVAGGNGNGPAANQLAQPCAVVVDAAGNIFVSDYQNVRIQKFLMNTSFIDTTYYPHTAGTYYAVVTDSAGCSITTNSIVIGVSFKPIATIIADKPSVCAGVTMGFTASATNTTGTPNYQWQINGVNVGANTTRYTNAALTNGDAVTCIVTNGGNCGESDTSNNIIAQINALPVLGPTQDVTIALGQSVVLNIPVSGNIASYLWSPSSTLSNNSILNPTATPLKTTTYILKVVSVDSCAANGAITVNVSSNIYFTSGFTPNGDGRNDVFYVLGGLAGDKIKDFSIFDRWGKRLFEVQNVLPNDISLGWNGKYNGTLQEQGSYVYFVTIVSASGAEKVYKGTVMLIR